MRAKRKQFSATFPRFETSARSPRNGISIEATPFDPHAFLSYLAYGTPTLLTVLIDKRKQCRFVYGNENANLLKNHQRDFVK